MAKTALNKNSLNKEKKSLGTFSRYLPSLELKRQQLMFERNKAHSLLLQTQKNLDEKLQQISEAFPMLACDDYHIQSPVKVKNIHLEVQNVVGVKLPVIQSINILMIPYNFLTQPHWMDDLTIELEKIIRLKIELQINTKRYQLIKDAVRTTTQRVNLFSKILIPRAKKNISSIKIFLSDQEKASVLNAKISKNKLAGNLQ